jgi:putative SOS response-associated peptidase YedK
MCGRYVTPAEADLERAWKLHAPTAYRQSYNLAPSQLAPVLLPADGGALTLELYTWGFQPAWSKRAWINARSETVFSSRAFLGAARRHRCLVPALGWYEWQGASPPRQPWIFHLDGFRPFLFAGIFTPPSETAGGNFAILTTEAAAPLTHVHNRMPVALDESGQRRWLAADLEAAEATAVLDRHLEDFRIYQVSNYVNKPANNDAACIAPI